MKYMKSLKKESLMHKKVALSGYFGFDNFGDDAILSVLCDKLKLLNAEITVFSANPIKTAKEFLVNSVGSFDLKNVIKTIFKTDVLISGGGSLLQDATSFKSLVYYSGIIFLALLFKKDVLIFAQGIGPLNHKMSKYIVLQLLKRAKYVSVRDEKSFEFLKSNNINAELVHDPVYSIIVPDVPKNFAVGLQLRDFSTMNFEFLNSLADNVLFNYPNRKIELFVFQKSIDEKICKQFAQLLYSKNQNIDIEIVYYNNRAEIFKRVSQLECMIAMRFHAIILALKAGIRVSAINYDIKVEKLAKEASIPLISLNDSINDYNAIFEHMKSLNQGRLSDFANSKPFNWSNFEKFFQ